MADVSREEVARIARLANVALPEALLDSLPRELSRVLAWVETLDQLELGGLQAFSHATEAATPLRADEVRDGLDIEAALAQAPERTERSFVVPKVIG